MSMSYGLPPKDGHCGMQSACLKRANKRDSCAAAIACNSRGPHGLVFLRATNLTVALASHVIIAPKLGCCRLRRASPGGLLLIWVSLSTGIRVACVVKVPVIMKLSTRLIDAFPTQWFDWERRDTRDAIVIVGIAIFTYSVGTFYDFALTLFQFGIAHADQEADDIIFVVFILGIAMTVFGFRRYQDLSREIKARSAAERDARDLARHDPLTGLPNRRFFDEKLDEYLGAVSATHQMAVFMLDLDGFKVVNDTYGHAAGDKALICPPRFKGSAPRHISGPNRRRRVRDCQTED